MFVLSKKLKSLKAVLKNLNMHHFSGIETRVKEAHEALVQCQYEFLLNPTTQGAELEKITHNVWLKLAEAEEKFLHQISRVQWLESGDCNSTFFP